MRIVHLHPAPQDDELLPRLQQWCNQFSHVVFFHRNNYSHVQCTEDWLLACGCYESVPASADALNSLYASHRQHGNWHFGYLSYDYRAVLEPQSVRLPQLPTQVCFEDFFFFRPLHVLRKIGDTLLLESHLDPEAVWQSIMRTPASEEPPLLPVTLKACCSAETYFRNWNKLRTHLADGDLYEINYCIEFAAHQLGLDPWWMMLQLIRQAPAPFACLLRHDFRYCIGASPERFLRKCGDRIMAQPMKGTAPRQADHAADKARLANDQKEQAENVMIVDLMRNDLMRCAQPGTVRVDELFGVYAFPQVLQMISTVSGQLRSELPFTEALRCAFPPGSMTGAPKIKAMELIERYEPRRRGLYSGIIGYITPEGDFDFHVVIRSFLYDSQTGALSLQTGSGITWYARPESEYAECLLKARSVINALPGFELTVDA
ncbi:MAG: anthranilate synthase component I family protein [Chitinophagales bacterium]|nr:anthranilate synthase component I family protein [Chitinophagales bacterium]MDW8393736.1 anthranilate synthase component I family protein [Chitinophagales bacterium]